jgi:hypothetical protein
MLGKSLFSSTARGFAGFFDCHLSNYCSVSARFLCGTAAEAKTRAFEWSTNNAR